MREIKFRAWFEAKKKMVRNLGFDNYAFMDLHDERIKGTSIMPMVWDLDVLREDGYEGAFNYEIMQCTGLKDKNGVEIYERDILSRESHWGWYVEFEDGGFRRVPVNEIQRINHEHYRLEQDGLEYWEVIGNIYENPELLEG